MSEPADRRLLPIASAAASRRYVLELLRRRPVLLTGTVLSILAGAVVGLAVPALIGLVVNIVSSGGDVSFVALASVGIAACGLVGAALQALGRSLLAVLTESALAEAREEVFESAMRIPLAEIERAGIGDVVARVSGDIRVVGDALGSVLPVVTTAGFTIIVTLGGLSVLDWRFALAALAAAPLQFYAVRRFGSSAGGIYRELRRVEAERGEVLIEAVTAEPTITALGIGGRHTAGVGTVSERAVGVAMSGMRAATRFYSTLNAGEWIGLSAILVVGFVLVSAGETTLGAATAAALFFHRLFDPLGAVLGQVDELQKSGAAIARAVGVIECAEPRPAAAESEAGPRGVVLDGIR
ncbi:MAG: ABC transporter transmembrane domain-containing protein, partial [Agromyces sp.]